MEHCITCQAVLLTAVRHCPYCGQAQAAVAQPSVTSPLPPPLPPSAPERKPPPAPVAPPAAPKPPPVPAPAPPRPAPQPQPVPPPATPAPPRRWLQWVAGIGLLAAVIVYMNGKPGGQDASACNDAIDSGLKLVANGSLDGARQKLATARNTCKGTSGAKADDLQAAIGKAGAASSGCQRSVRGIERDIDGQRLQSAARGIAALDADCAGASTVDALRKQLARQQAAAASVQVGVRQALDGKDVAAAHNAIARLEAIDREAPALPQLKAQVQALSLPAPAASPVAPLAETAPARSVSTEAAPARMVERPVVVERRPLEAAPVDNGAAMRNEMAQSFLRDAERSLNEGKFDAAKTYLDSARRADPGNARLDSLSRRIRERERQVLQTETTIK